MFGHPGIIWEAPSSSLSSSSSSSSSLSSSSSPPPSSLSFTHHLDFRGVEYQDLCGVSSSFCDDIENVSSLSLSHSSMEGGGGGLPGWLRKTTPVSLHLSHCHLKHFEEGKGKEKEKGGEGGGEEVIGKMRCVEYLDLSWNMGLKLSCFPQFLTVLILNGSLERGSDVKEILNLEFLITLHLDYCCLEAFPFELLCSTVIQDLSLAHNNISSLEGWEKLEEKDENEEEEKEDYPYSDDDDDDERPFSQLRRLNLSHNSLTTLPSPFFSRLKLLKILDLSHNKINEFEGGGMEVAKGMRWLSLSNNLLLFLPIAFSKGSDLRYLDVSHNKLLWLPRSLLKLKKRFFFSFFFSFFLLLFF